MPGRNGMPRMLPRIRLEDGKMYWIDERLNELRNVEDPGDRIPLWED